MSSQLFIDDSYVIETGKACADLGQKLEGDFDDFLKIMQDISSNAVISGATHDAAKAYLQTAGSLKTQLSAISAEVDKACRSLITQIDADDQWLY
ncbi:hypothetical protein [Bifidobacterium bombi]|uniref:hypothetical protein n=1 Tax=Bifidobacterium bombi TaxID=471511 RepID=UPI0005C4E289|nr:hypothetical protein [Bifidobacterium bombi]